MRETAPSDRVQLRSQSELRDPGSCALCGSGHCDDGYVDLGVWIEFLGNVYLCMNCMEQAIGAVRGLTPSEANELTTQANFVALQNKELLQEVEELREHKRSVDFLLARAAVDYAVNDITAALESKEQQFASALVARTDDEPANGTPSGSADGESTPKKSGTGRRSVRTKPAESSNDSQSPKFDL